MGNKKKVIKKKVSNRKQIMWGVISTNSRIDSLSDVHFRGLDSVHINKEYATDSFDDDYRYNYLFEFEINNIFTDKTVVNADNLTKVTLK